MQKEWNSNSKYSLHIKFTNSLSAFHSNYTVLTINTHPDTHHLSLTHTLIELEWQDDSNLLHQLEDLFEPCYSYALVDMSRLEPKNRQKNEQFGVMLRRKLRLVLWPGERLPVCFCGQSMDHFGDHVLSCRSHCKTAMSNATRNGLADLSKKIYSLVKLISSDACVDKETRRIVKALPNLCPFDYTTTFAHFLTRPPGVHHCFSLDLMLPIPISNPRLSQPPSQESRAARKTDINWQIMVTNLIFEDTHPNLETDLLASYQLLKRGRT